MYAIDRGLSRFLSRQEAGPYLSSTLTSPRGPLCCYAKVSLVWLGLRGERLRDKSESGARLASVGARYNEYKHLYFREVSLKRRRSHAKMTCEQRQREIGDERLHAVKIVEWQMHARDRDASLTQ
jgi:hypothetical protein